MKITLKNITKKFGSTIAAKDFSCELPDGHLICVLGPSGCGKSTILNMLCGIVQPTEGQIFFDDEDVTKLPPDQRNIGMVFQNYALYPHLTVLENISFPLEIKKVPKKERFEKAKEIAKLVQVDGLLKRYPAELSGGQQQRVAIARALIKNPKMKNPGYPENEWEAAQIEVKYKYYIEKQDKRVEKLHKMENTKIPADFDYGSIPSLSAESRYKLEQIRPVTLGQANRISGIRNSDIMLLMVYLKR